MSHIHIPDGELPFLLILIGYLLTALFLFLAFKNIKMDDVRRKVPYIGIMAALMLLTMSIPLGFIPFHLNLAVLVGILAGPAFGFIVIFVVNILLSFLGHGGITMVGINTLIIGSEVLVGSLLFGWLSKRKHSAWSAAVSCITGLLVSTCIMASIIAGVTGQLEGILPHTHAHEDPISLVENQDEINETVGHHNGETKGTIEHNDELDEHLKEVRFISLSGWSAVAAILFVGMLIEAFVTGTIIDFFLKVRPDMIASHRID